MNNIFLAVWFLTLGGELIVADGYHPRPQPSMEVCLERRDALDDYIFKNMTPLNEQVREDVIAYTVRCVEHGDD